MSTRTTAPAAPLDVRALHERMGRVYHQPIPVRSFTNKRFTVNFRVPVPELRRLLPAPIEPDEVRDTGLGVLSMCACDFWVTRMGGLPIPPVRNNDMLCRVSARIPKRGRTYRAYYTLRSDSSSRFIGFFGRRFSHFRKQVSDFARVDDGGEYRLECRAADPLGGGALRARMRAVTKEAPAATVFADLREATDFVFNLDGSCGYDYASGRLSFQPITYPEWDMYFCHEVDYRFPLVEHLIGGLGLHAELDSTLFMEKTPQTWGASWLYREAPPAAPPARR
jgi:hypothetical protein